MSGKVIGIVLIASVVLPDDDPRGEDRPIVAVCRAGSRSAQAVTLLQQESFAEVANLAGGMLRWRAEGRETVGGST